MLMTSSGHRQCSAQREQVIIALKVMEEAASKLTSEQLALTQQCSFAGAAAQAATKQIAYLNLAPQGPAIS